MKSLMRRCLPIGVCAVLAGCGTVVESSKPSEWVWYSKTNPATGEWESQRIKLVDNRLPPGLLAAPEVDAPEPVASEQQIAPDPVLQQPEPVIEQPVIPEPEPSVVIEQAPEPEEPLVNNPARGSLPSNRGFYIQLAAFARSEAIKRFIDEHQLADQSLNQHYILSNDRYWHVLTAGYYQTRGDAAEAADLLQQQHPGLEPWVRSALSLHQAIEAAR